MKKLFMLVAFLGLVNFVQAQCTKSAKTAGEKTACCAKTASAKAACCAKTAKVAAKAASLDESVEKRVCEKSGTVSYVKKSVCAHSGTVSFDNVEYCSKSKKFVNVSPSDSGAKAVNASMEAAPKPACTKSKAACSKSKAACTKSKAACSKSKAACDKTKTAGAKAGKMQKATAVKVSTEQQ